MLSPWRPLVTVYEEVIHYTAALMFESGFGGYINLEAVRRDGQWRAGVEMHTKVWLTQRFDTAEDAQRAAISLAKQMLVECATELLQLEIEVIEVKLAQLPEVIEGGG